MNAYGFMIIPKSWARGKWIRGNKVILAFGPFRIFKTVGLQEWKWDQKAKVSKTSDLT